LTLPNRAFISQTKITLKLVYIVKLFRVVQKQFTIKIDYILKLVLKSTTAQTQSTIL
jgi:hypothetical protein